MDKNIHDVWSIIKEVVFIGVILLIIFVKIVDWGKTAPKQIETIQTEVESIKN